MKRRPGRRGTFFESLPPLLFAAILAGGLAHPPAVLAGGPAPVEQAQRIAKELELHEHPYWWTLLHYKRTWRGVQSLVDDPDFFLAEDGKSNPKAELAATIAAFLQEDGDGAEEAACRFIARYRWLSMQLAVAGLRLPELSCTPFEEMMEQVKPRAVTFIFPTSYINSPASMFGHTLLRIETRFDSRLMSYAVNYSATTDESNGLLFAFKGIFGLYEGYFSIMPYYQKVQEYSDIDQRDIWEYPMTLDSEEVSRMMMHLWELQNIHSDYFFFDENCSYTLLFLLDAARPGLTLTDRFGLWVMPIDTIRGNIAAGLMDGADYRPARATRIRHVAAALDRSGRDLALDVVHGNLAPAAILDEAIPVSDKAGITELAIEYIQYLYSKKKLTKEVYLERFMEVSKVRSELGDLWNSPVGEMEAPPQPERGHGPNRLSIGFGVKGWKDLEEESPFQEIRFRPTYHDLLDMDEGFIEGSQIEFFNTTLRYYFDEETVEIETLDFLNILSISPRDRFFKPFSWKVRTGFMEQGPQSRGGLTYRLSTGAGVAHALGPFGLGYLFADAEVDLGEHLSGHHAIGGGGSLGVIAEFFDIWRIHLSARSLYFGLGDRHARTDLTLSQQVGIGRNRAVSVDVSGRAIADVWETEAGLTMHFYF